MGYIFDLVDHLRYFSPFFGPRIHFKNVDRITKKKKHIIAILDKHIKYDDNIITF